MFQSIYIDAASVLSVEEQSEGRAGVPFLNWRFRAKHKTARSDRLNRDDLMGCGLYSIGFDAKLIYVGSFLGAGKDGAYLTGDVAFSRWWTHIAAITGRGHRLHVSRRTLKSLKSELGESHPMVRGFLDAKDPPRLHTDQGTLSPLRRLRFAAQRTDIFLAPHACPQKILSRFTFSYVRFRSIPAGYSPQRLKQHILEGETALIGRFVPSCNASQVDEKRPPVDIADSEMVALMTESLGRLD